MCPKPDLNIFYALVCIRLSLENLSAFLFRYFRVITIEIIVKQPFFVYSRLRGREREREKSFLFGSFTLSVVNFFWQNCRKLFLVKYLNRYLHTASTGRDEKRSKNGCQQR